MRSMELVCNENEETTKIKRVKVQIVDLDWIF